MFFPSATRSGEPPLTVMANLSGGLAGGDRLRIGATVEPGAALSVTTQAAEKVYRAAENAVARVEADIELAEGAWLDWLPRPSILFDGARIRRRMSISLARSSRLLASDTWIFGRRARGERFATGELHDRWTVIIEDRLAWMDALRIDEPDAVLASACGLAGAGAMATALYAGEDASERIELARKLLEGAASQSGVTLVGGDRILLARLLGERPEQVRRDADHLVSGLRQALGFSPTLPRIGND